MTSNPTVAPTDEDFLVAVEEALEGVLLPYDGVGALEAARNAVVAAVGPLVAQLRQAVFPEPPSRAASLSVAERQFLTFALDLAADEMASRGDEFGAEDQAALESLRRLAAEARQPCPTPCDPDCDAACHEVHQPPRKRDHQPNDHAVEAQQQPEPEAGPWVVHKICCGHDDGKAEFTTWEAADSFREVYIDSARIADHERSAIIRRNDAPAPVEPAAADSEETRRCACPHPADEHSVYGCVDGCGCEWMPRRKSRPAPSS